MLICDYVLLSNGFDFVIAPTKVQILEEILDILEACFEAYPVYVIFPGKIF